MATKTKTKSAKVKTKASAKKADTSTTAEPAPVLLGDQDVSDVDPGSGKGEVGPLILQGYWVRLSEHEDVPEAYAGHLAVVIDSPWKAAPCGLPGTVSPIDGYTFDEDASFRVQTRDEANAILEVPQEAFSAVAPTRGALENHG